MSRIRLLPLRRAPRPDEGIDSWIEALAARHAIAPAHLLPRLGIPDEMRRISRLVTELTPGQIASAQKASGLPAGTLALLAPGELRIAGYLRTGGSRYCPQCLAASDGIWPLRWRLAWVFACSRHARLLRDTCQECGGVQRVNLYAGLRRMLPAFCCSRPAPGGGRCAADLRLAKPGRRLTPPLARTAGWIEQLLADLDDPGSRETAAAVLADLPTVALWLMRRHAKSGTLKTDAPVHDGLGRVMEARLHRDALLTAAVVSQAHHVMAGPEHEAVAHVREVLRRHPGAARIPPPGMARDQWMALASGFDRRMIRAADPDLIAIDRLRMKSMTVTPQRIARPVRGGKTPPVGPAPRRGRLIPQVLWPDWSAKLLPAAGLEAEQFRTVISVCLLIPATAGRTLSDFAALLSPHLTSQQISVTLQFFRALPGSPSGDALTEVLAVLCRLADYLDAHGSPIDYQRRREQLPADPIDWPAWCDLALSAGTQPGARPGRARHLHAQRYLHHLLTGSDLSDPAYPLTFTGPGDRINYLGFALALTPRLRTALHQYAAGLLEQHGIDEPVAWSPPAETAEHLPWPGVDLDTLDLEAIRRIVIEDKRPVAEAARALGVHSEHIRLAIERIDRPEPQWSIHGPDAWIRRQRAPHLLTRDFFEHEYVQGGRRLKQIAKDTGYSRKLLATYAKDAGITLAKAIDPFPIDPQWLREQYHTLRRSTADIARELDTHQMNVNHALYRHGITPRLPGVHSFPEMIAKLPPGIPRAIRQAVEGGLRGWERLRRFQITMRFPTATTAGTYLGITHSSLIHQFQRLEDDLGTALFDRAVIGTPQHPTKAGTRLLRHLEREDVNALMAEALRDRPGFDLPPEDVLDAAHRAFAAPQRPRRPQAPYDDIPVARYRIRPPTLALLRHLLQTPDREFYGLEVHQATGIDMGTLYPLLRKLEHGGWLTSKPEDDDEWRAGAPPGKGPGKRRIYYQLTPDGHRAAQREIERCDHRDAA
ncbi:TniQ family protein [Actinocrinis puniceicyclus]|uniref:TniQ family protein n=1 Tax=Actinocrinis puniceicyclus TaxID=977794 RepID=A0A8J7WJH1_9ACTN|nr:TniQ family protein [Actinocrinis puniceicyclus]MBS2963436.1 TniQ family protein [Actinocrinis puniceicyclus]